MPWQWNDIERIHAQLAAWINEAVQHYNESCTNHQLIMESMVEWCSEPMNRRSMYPWVNEPVNQWAKESMNQWLIGQWAKESMNQGINESLNQSNKEAMNLANLILQKCANPSVFGVKSSSRYSRMHISPASSFNSSSRLSPSPVNSHASEQTSQPPWWWLVNMTIISFPAKLTLVSYMPSILILIIPS